MLKTYYALRFCWPHILKYRVNKGKLDNARLDEYRGIASIERPKGGVIWLHGVSVGESLSALPLIMGMKQRYPDKTILLTSTTKASAELIVGNLPENVIHQYLPLDHPDWVKAFYDHWQPELGIWVESELWPNLLLQADGRAIPRILLNGRMSKGSFNRWSIMPKTARRLFSNFAHIQVQDDSNLGFFLTLGAENAKIGHNLKDAASALPADEAGLKQWAERLDHRCFWLATSTHDGEEHIILAAHQILRKKFPEMVCVLVPRHPDRGAALVMDLQKKSSFDIQLLSKNDQLSNKTGILIVDKLGVLGILYRLAQCAFIGGSLVPKGGHNMREALLLGCVPIVGPYLENFSVHQKQYQNFYRTITDAVTLAETVENILDYPDSLAGQIQEAQYFTEQQPEDIIPQILDELAPFVQGK